MKAEWTNNDSLTTSQTTKAILVIDEMPSACDECKFESEMLNCGKPMCVATPHRRERIDDDSIRPSWCPLKPMSKKLQFQEPFNDDYTVSWASRLGFVDGWNACLDKITGETK